MEIDNNLFQGADSSNPGYRLQSLEIYNWGTFHQKLWRILPDTQNALLTGDIGSGKSTLVDAITTLLVPHHKIVFNAAAGAQSKERTIRSYILGEYKNVREEVGLDSKAISLRDPRSTYSVLLAHFSNQALEETISLAQVLWVQDGKDQKFFVVAKGTLSFQNHFTQFGSDVLGLKSKLRKIQNTEVLDTFKEYSQRFRQFFGMSTDKTLMLFYQTVSMKSVDNLTLFVRNHMLDEPDAKDQLNHLLKNFENLQKAHESVIKARKQTEMLQPIVDEGVNYDAISKKLSTFENARMALPGYVAEKKLGALQCALDQAKNELQVTEEDIRTVERDLGYLKTQLEEIQQAYSDMGGNRIDVIKNKIEILENEKTKRRSQWERYIERSNQLKLAIPDDVRGFNENRKKAELSSEEIGTDKEKLSNAELDLKISKNNLSNELEQEQKELESLLNRKNQIPEHLISLRFELIQALGLQEEQIPFAGELLQVKEEESSWEGAIERVLNGLALSLLVQEEHYYAVNEYINRTNLRGRLVYFRTHMKASRNFDTIPENSLINKINIRTDTPFDDWLQGQLEDRYNYVCVENLEEFRRTPYAITQQGLIKQRKGRHEKDDRRRISDRRYYVLGWTNEKKISAVHAEMRRIKEGLSGLEIGLQKNAREQQMMTNRLNVILGLLHFQQFEEIDWKYPVSRIEDLKKNIEELEQSSDELAALKASKDETQKQWDEEDKKRIQLNQEKGRLAGVIASFEKDQENTSLLLTTITIEEKEDNFPTLDKLNKDDFTLDNAEQFRQQLLETIDHKINLRKSEQTTSRNKITSYMVLFTRSFAEDTIELQPTIEYFSEMKDLYEKLKNDDLPKYEEKFKELLQKGTINDIALFKNKLEETGREIVDKIDIINQSLEEIEYNPGTYIRLMPHENNDREISDFKSDLKNCLAHSLGQESYYSEEKYLQVKQLLDRFQNEQEKRWRDKVIDVRNWYGFGASEQSFEDAEEVNYYSDSSGKSGGQKEKLAYTVLASALAYQYGIHDDQKMQRAFRFVVIDEAFGRGSDESTRFGLELFNKMGLQVLVVTPLQKINVIQPYIKYVHFVSNPTGENSEVVTLTKKQFRDREDELRS